MNININNKFGTPANSRSDIWSARRNPGAPVLPGSTAGATAGATTGDGIGDANGGIGVERANEGPLLATAASTNHSGDKDEGSLETGGTTGAAGGGTAAPGGRAPVVAATGEGNGDPNGFLIANEGPPFINGNGNH